MGLIGDGTTSALVGLDGGVAWLCVPRFDSEPLFCGLLDHARGGCFTAAPDEVIEARRRYEPDIELEGCRRSAPVRWGNGAADQRQHDVYGEVLDCAYQWVRGG